MTHNVLEHLEQLRREHPEIQAEYDRLTPRFAVIRQLIRARQEAGVSQAELARRMGVRQPVVARLEAGEHSPRLDSLVRAAEALGCDLTVQLVKRHGESERPKRTTRPTE